MNCGHIREISLELDWELPAQAELVEVQGVTPGLIGNFLLILDQAVGEGAL